VAILILRSAVQLVFDVARSLAGNEDVDLSRYEMPLAEQYERFRQVQLGDWMLFLVAELGVASRAELVSRARVALDFGDNPVLQELQLAERPNAEEMITQSLTRLFECGWLEEHDRLAVTDPGKDRLRQWKWGAHWETHGFSVDR
jgi:hypothetical protein